MNQITLIALGLILCLLGGLLMCFFLHAVNMAIENPTFNSKKYEIIILFIMLLMLAITYIIISNL